MVIVLPELLNVAPHRLHEDSVDQFTIPHCVHLTLLIVVYALHINRECSILNMAYRFESDKNALDVSVTADWPLKATLVATGNTALGRGAPCRSI